VRWKGLSGMSEPQVSIVISTFNRAHRLPEALRALARQSVAVPHEVIVVDNHSTDGTSAIVESCRAWFGVPLHYVLEPRRGVSYARNAGIHWARGALLAFVDDDVQVDGAWLERLVDVAAAHPEIDCFGGKVLPRWRQIPPTWLDRRHWSPVALTDHGDEPFTVSAVRPQCLISANLIVRRRAFDRAGLFSPDFRRSQDHEWLVRFWRAGLVGLYHPAIVVWVDVDAERLTRRYHRRWHVQHGRYAARMRLREVIDQEGRLRLGALPACARMFGTPRFVFRELMREGLAAVGFTLTGAHASRRFERFDAVCDLLGYIRESALMWAADREQGRGDRRMSGSRLPREVEASDWANWTFLMT
jgi:glucosyl-dolichyl phosphate glucuronosyltransferase